MVDLSSISSVQKLEELSEGVDLEAKAAQGRSGTGAVPHSVWETYSSFANTSGGVIVLGVEEKPDNSLHVVGLREAERVKRDFISALNGGKCNRNLLNDEHIQVLNLDGLEIVAIVVPRASRTDRPIFVDSNPLNGSYRRINDADIRCDEQTVKAMLADALAEDRSAKMVEGYEISDLDSGTIERYKASLATSSAGNPLLKMDTEGFLRQIGAATLDRATSVLRPTLAGLILFGQHAAIVERLPNFLLDYRRVDDASDSSPRYSDRVIWDGKWSGNLFDFFELISPKVYAAIPNVFALSGVMQRIDNSSVQIALREALVNSIIHADYELGGGVVIVQGPDRFHFRNPGMMRVPVEQAVQGGISDCRNAKLQQMFRLAGYADQMGSGVSKIIEAWFDRSWRLPELSDASQPDRTELKLRMEDFLPARLLPILQRIGPISEAFSRTEKYCLGLALLGNRITNRQVHERTAMHARDVTLMLAQLVDRGLLTRSGRTTAAYYTTGPVLEAASRVNSGEVVAAAAISTARNSVSSAENSTITEFPTTELGTSEAEYVRVRVEESIIDLVRNSSYSTQERLEEAILLLCVTPHSVAEGAERLNRGLERVRGLLQNLVRTRRIGRTKAAHHPQQKYLSITAYSNENNH